MSDHGQNIRDLIQFAYSDRFNTQDQWVKAESMVGMYVKTVRRLHKSGLLFSDAAHAAKVALTEVTK